MALFEKNYRAAAVADIERSIRDLEERNKRAETKPVFLKDVGETHSNLDLVERLNLVTVAQAEAFRNRVAKAHFEFEKMQRTETRDDIVDSFENPREITARYQKMEEYSEQIKSDRASTATAPSADKGSLARGEEPRERT